MLEYTTLTPKVRKFNFSVGETLEYHPLNDRTGNVIAFYKLSDMVAFEDRLTRKHNWRLTPDLDHDMLTVSLDHEDMTTGPSVTIPLYAITKERNAAVKDLMIAYQKEQKDLETADPQKNIVTDRQPAGRQTDGRFDAFASDVYESLRPYHQKTHNHMLKIETAVSPLYFPVNQIRELVNILKPTRRTDDDPVCSFSVMVDYVTVDVKVGYKWIKENHPKVTLTIKTDGQVKTITNLYGSLDNPMENRPTSAVIVWSLPQVNPIPSDRLTAILDFVSYCPPMTETETAVSPIAETTIPQTITQPAAIAPETAVSAQPAKPAAMVTQPAQPVKIAQPEVKETAVSQPKPKRKRTAKKPAWRDNPNRLTRDAFLKMLVPTAAPSYAR